MMGTWNLDEGIPNAGSPAVFIRHPFNLVSRGRRSEDETLWETASTQPTHVEFKMTPISIALSFCCCIISSAEGEKERLQKKKDKQKRRRLHIVSYFLLRMND